MIDYSRVIDPLKLANELWPHVVFYKQQKEIIYSVLNNDETYVPAGNMLGKDFVSGFLAVYFFLTRHPCRIVTTSAKDDHLRVLWGEIMRFIQTCKYPLDSKKGGPLILNHQDIRKMIDGDRCPLSYMTGLVANEQSIAAMQGHHIAKTGDNVPRTLFISDESSSVPDDYYKMACTWANRILVIGNTWPCQNFFRRGVKDGDLKHPTRDKFYRKVVRIRAVDSPNVRYALAQQKAGEEPDNKIIVPGVKDWEEYQKNLRTWDPIQQKVSLDAEFDEGATINLFPTDWLLRSNSYAAELKSNKPRRQARAIGVDSAEGGDKSCWAVVDEYGLIDLISLKTPDTSIIPTYTLALMDKYDVDAEQVMFDRGGGGKQHADYMRARMGKDVRTVGFGELVVPDPRVGVKQVDEKIDEREEKSIYKNRRAQMYGTLRTLLDPNLGLSYLLPDVQKAGGLMAAIACDSEDEYSGFGIPAHYNELFKQLSVMPLMYDGEGKMVMLPKNKRSPGSNEKTLVELIGHSPDESDALVLAIYGMLFAPYCPVVGAIR